MDKVQKRLDEIRKEPTYLADKILVDGRILVAYRQITNAHLTISAPGNLVFGYDDDY